MENERPLQIVGAINAYCAMLAEQGGFAAIYLSGAGVANASYGLPDLGMTTLDNVLEDVRRITGATRLPLLVDADTGWGGALMTARAACEIERAGAAGLHIEDQVQAKRCGHRPGKSLVSAGEMSGRLKAAVDARVDRDFVVMARTDAYSVEGLPAAIDRACRYVEAGADMVFAEAMATLEDYRRFASSVRAPLLANLTEFGKTPLFSLEQMRQAGVAMVLYPLSAFRAMSTAALKVYQTLRQTGSQQGLLDMMQTREDLYAVLKYHDYERKLGDLSSERKSHG
jgi:methylisocitrate lyase